jgi:hypothetical protein
MDYGADFYMSGQKIVNPAFYDEYNRLIEDPKFYENESIQPYIRSVSYFTEVILIPMPRASDRPAFEVRIIRSDSEIDEENESARRINLNDYFLNTSFMNYEESISALKKKYRITNGPPSNPMNVPSNIGNRKRLTELKNHLIEYKKILERVLAKPLKNEVFKNLFIMNLKKSFYEDPLSSLMKIAKIYPNLELNKPEIYGSPEEIQKRIDEIDNDYTDFMSLQAKNKEERVKFNAVINKNGTKKRFRLAAMGGKRRSNKKSRRVKIRTNQTQL